MTPRQLDRAVALVAAAVVASVAIAAAPVTWRLLGRDDGRRHVASVAAAAPEPPLDLGPLTRFAPFGNKVATPGVAGSPTALGLQLRGVLLARPAAGSTALIAAANSPAKGFRVGETLPGGAILDTIEFDLVVLRVNGQLVTLALPTRAGGGDSAVAGPMPGGSVPAASPARAPASPIEAYRDKADDPLSLLGSLGAVAGADGYRIGPSPSADLRRAGLQPGDIVEKVNGQPVGDPKRDRALFDDAVVAGKMRVEVVRDGKHIAMSFPLH